MKKKDLKSGMMVMTNNGFSYLVLRDTGLGNSDYMDRDVLLGISATGKFASWMGLSGYNDDLENEDEYYSIAEVFTTDYAENFGRIKCYKSIWKRELTR